MKTLKQFIYHSLLVTLILMTSCENDDTSKKTINRSETPIEIIDNTIDLDSDTEIDFKISEYEIQTDDIPSSAGTLYKNITPLNEYTLLTDNDGAIYKHTKGDTLRRADFDNKILFKSSAIDLIRKGRVFDVYDEEWTNTVGEYVVFKSDSIIGWFKFKFDLKEGSITIKDHEITDKSIIVLE